MQQNEVISRSGTEHFLRLLKKKIPKTKQRKRFSFVEMRGPILFLGYFEALYLYQLFTDDYQLQGETMIFFLTMLTKQTSVSRVPLSYSKSPLSGLYNRDQRFYYRFIRSRRLVFSLQPLRSEFDRYCITECRVMRTRIATQSRIHRRRCVN